MTLNLDWPASGGIKRPRAVQKHRTGASAGWRSLFSGKSQESAWVPGAAWLSFGAFGLDIGVACRSGRAWVVAMKGSRFVYWQDGQQWLGYLEEFPDYLTQGESLEDLKEHLRDLHADLTSGQIPAVRRLAELEVA